MRRILLWDFDGTLGYRDGGWSATLAEIIQDDDWELDFTAEEIRPRMQAGYFWHRPETPHTHIHTADHWWATMQPVFERALRSIGLDNWRATRLAEQFRARYVDVSRWHLYDDTLSTLAELSARGFDHMLLSNHVPELPGILNHLGLTPHLARVFNSAQTGYEKPNPRAFEQVRQAYPNAHLVCMIGDSLTADVQGAEAAGIPGILVRRFHEGMSRLETQSRQFAPDLPAALPLIDQILREGIH